MMDELYLRHRDVTKGLQTGVIKPLCYTNAVSPESEDPTSGCPVGLAKVSHPPSFGHSGPFRHDRIRRLAATRPERRT